jgi:hypothetical protein
MSHTMSKINPANTIFRPAAISARLPSVLIFSAPYIKPLVMNYSSPRA